MKIAVTGATGFLGRYIVNRLAPNHACRCWYRAGSDRAGFEQHAERIEWAPGELGDPAAARDLVAGCDAVVHAALYRPSKSFMGGEGDLLPFVEQNLLGSLRILDAARRAGVGRFIFISTCAVHDKVLDDRPLDETHPLWPLSHYGAYKAAVEKFVHSFGYGQGYPVCALRPTGIYGLEHRPDDSKWFDLVRSVVRGETVECRAGGKEVHAADVAQAVELLLAAPGIAGESFACFDRYISQHEVATIAREISGSKARIEGERTRPKHQIVTEKIQRLGMQFGGEKVLHGTIGQLVRAASQVA